MKQLLSTLKSKGKQKQLQLTFIYTFSELLSKSIPFLLIPILTERLTVSEYGIVNNFLVLIGVLVVVVKIGTDSIISSEYYENTHEKNASLISSSTYLNIVISCVLAILFLPLQEILSDKFQLESSHIFMAIMVALSNVVYLSITTIIRFEKKAYQYMFLQVGYTVILMGLCAYFVIFNHYGLSGYIHSYFIANSIFIIVGLIILQQKSYLLFQFDKQVLIKILILGSPLILQQMTWWVKGGLDKLYLTNYLSTDENAYFSLVFQLCSAIQILLSGFFNTFSPYLFENLSNNPSEEKKRKVVKVVYLSALGFLVLCIGSGVVIYGYVSYFISEKYTPSLVLIPELILSNYLISLYSLVSVFFFLKQKTKSITIITVAVTLIHVVLSPYLIHSLGTIGSVRSLWITNLLNFVLVAYFSNRIFPMPWLSFLKKENEEKYD